MAEIKERSCSEIPNDSDTISRQAAIDKFISSPMFRREVKMGIVNVLEDLPSSDVIRCKDCKYLALTVDVENVLSLLDGIHSSGRMEYYSDYCALHDAIAGLLPG